MGETPFVTMKLTVDEKAQIIVEAFQVTICLWCSLINVFVI